MTIPLGSRMIRRTIAVLLAHAGIASAQSLDATHRQQLEQRANDLLPKMVAWRRDIHEHPEMSGQEVRTSKLVADHLRQLGMANPAASKALQ